MLVDELAHRGGNVAFVFVEEPVDDGGGVLEVLADGQQVVKGDLVVVLEAMKMEQPIQAHKDGVIGAINADPGTTVSAGHQLLTIS